MSLSASRCETVPPTGRRAVGNGLVPTQSQPAPPPLHLLLMELRALGEFVALGLLYRSLKASPRGDGHPVLVLPGLLSSDWSTGPMRRLLATLGYTPYGWGLGVNRGPRADLVAALRARVDSIVQRHGRRLTLIGTSLGGIYARQIAKAMPQAARAVITLGSPFAGSPRATRAWRLYERVSGFSVDDCDSHLGGALAAPPPVPTTAIYSMSDGICAWPCCVERPGPLSESIHIPGSHLGLPHNPLVLHVVADRLAQPEGRFSPYPRADLAGLVRRILAGAPRGAVPVSLPSAGS